MRANGRQRLLMSANRDEERRSRIHISCEKTDVTVYDAANVTQGARRLRFRPTMDRAALTTVEFLGADGHGRSTLFTSLSVLEWLVMLETRPNVLLIGEVEATEAIITALTGSPRSVCDWGLGDPLPAPSTTATLVIREVCRLSPALQDAWTAWMDRAAASCPQILTTSSVEVWPLVEHAVFRSTLYYRLNTVLLKAELAREA
jgi:hypothetical protein